MKDWKQKYYKVVNDNVNIHPGSGGVFEEIESLIEQIISERDKEWDKWKVLAEAMDKAPVGHRVIIKHLLGEDEWTLTRRNK